MGEGWSEQNTDRQIRVTWIIAPTQLASSFANTFKDTGNQEAQLKQGEVWNIENVTLGRPSPTGHAPLTQNTKSV